MNRRIKKKKEKQALIKAIEFFDEWAKELEAFLERAKRKGVIKNESDIQDQESVEKYDNLPERDSGKTRDDEREEMGRMIQAGWFLIGAIFGAVAVIVIACCAVAGDADREEEKRRK